MVEYDKNKYARIHSIESFGTVDGPRNKVRYIHARLLFKM